MLDRRTLSNRNKIAFGFERKCTVIKNFFPKRVKSRKHNTHTVLSSWFHTDTHASRPPRAPCCASGQLWSWMESQAWAFTSRGRGTVCSGREATETSSLNEAVETEKEQGAMSQKHFWFKLLNWTNHIKLLVEYSLTYKNGEFICSNVKHRFSIKFKADISN